MSGMLGRTPFRSVDLCRRPLPLASADPAFLAPSVSVSRVIGSGVPRVIGSGVPRVMGSGVPRRPFRRILLRVAGGNG
ncbi:hypothetical protein GCM10012279_51280 [Micromonospora yangpuensis]|nr:hypothetical protein GCM10012279_51280 [Micromonospora yangpuensis]